MEREAQLVYEDITNLIIGAFFDVYNELGYGFLESVYKRAMVVGLSARGVHCVQERLFSVMYLGQNVGDYRADLTVEEKVIVEIKSGPSLLAAHESQLYNYLKASGLRIGLLMNFGPEASYTRHILTPNYKRPRSKPGSSTTVP